MASWKKTITTPFKKACTFFNNQPPRDQKKSQPGLSPPSFLTFFYLMLYNSHSHSHPFPDQETRVMDLHGEVMACGYEDVQVMWSILDKSKSTNCNIPSST
ncbi:hypothetical protein LR48_Vigan01g289900 [Vigna angularis]|uniref:Uncharacterized protein n=1 Tax=Phaseolus angularis TaxID=3914 RepID=A0A0L9TRY4_PHAAN|nr:hypothetical protein LR48_Vigan01g289900 [Vigna angularis]